MNYIDLFDMMEKLENEEEDQSMIVESITKSLKNIYIMNKKIENKKTMILNELLELKQVQVETNKNSEPEPIVKHEQQAKTNSEEEIKDRVKFEKEQNTKNINKKPPQTKINISIQDPKEKLVKKLYKKIALHYHPDKCKNKHKYRMFHYVNNGNDTKNIVMLIYIIHRFDLSEDLHLDSNDLKILNDELQKLKRREKELDNNIYYQWEKLCDNFKKNYKNHILKTI